MSSQKKCVPLVTEPRYVRTCCRNLCTMIYNNLPCSGPKTRHLPVAVDVTTDIARDCEVISVFCVVYTSECSPMFLVPLVLHLRSSFS